jgi:2-C-methyl-D-erythritol 2,4-cyclodiphosphate synthase
LETLQAIWRLLFSGFVFSTVRWLEMLAMGLFAYRVTESAFIVALLSMLRLLPMGLFGALLGALALGDIGRHFPDTDPQYRGIRSLLLLQLVMKQVRDLGWDMVNADITLVAQEPRFAPHELAIRQSLATTLGVEIDQISMKATTTEGLGFAGRKEGIACQAVALLQRQARA